MPLAPVALHPLHVLLVEDDDDHAELTLTALMAHDGRHRATRAHDGAEALDMLFRRGTHAAARRPDLILLDLNLPRVSGLEVLEAVKADPALRAIPVVVLTTSADEGDRQQAYHNYTNSYLVKPVAFDQFETMIHEFGEYWARWNRSA